MLEDINKRINIVKDQVAEKKVLKDNLNNLSTQIYMTECELRDLEEELTKELNDVEKLKKLSLSSFISTIMGNKAEKMEKEEKEYLTSKLKYDECSSRLDSLKKDKFSLENRLNDLTDCENRYSQLLETKISLANIYSNEVHKNRILSMEKEIDNYLKEIKEIEESIEAGRCLDNEIRDTKRILESAKNWGTLDLLGGDLISSMAKHEKIDEAQEYFIKISNLVTRFNKELKDVNISSLNFSSTTKTFDIFLDNIFTDISVNNQIDKSYQDICNLQGKVSSILENLKDKKIKLCKIVDNKRNEYNEFISNL